MSEMKIDFPGGTRVDARYKGFVIESGGDSAPTTWSWTWDATMERCSRDFEPPERLGASVSIPRKTLHPWPAKRVST